MRRPVVFVTLLALATPFAAAAGVRAPGDGTLSVRDLEGQITVRIWSKGGVIGRCDRCSLFLDERIGSVDEVDPIVSGARGIDVDEDGAKERFTGRDLRWRIMDTPFRMVIRRGVDVDLSIVGKGNVSIQGTAPGGTFVLNGESHSVIPGVSFSFKLHPVPLTGP
jgi:hypothetical protein